MEIGKKFLPIGTVVMLKGGKAKAMIAGFCAIGNESEKVYDYSGCVYPEGFLASDKICLFDHEQIEKVFHIGLVDEEEKNFKKKLGEMLPSLLAKKSQENEEVIEVLEVEPENSSSAIELPSLISAPTINADDSK